MKSLKISLLCAFLVMGLSAAAQDSDPGFFKRNWDNMIARYNIYFNATLKFDKATKQLYESHVDDFEEFLEVYPYGSNTDAKGMRGPMEEVMKKASKVIQNKPYSKWADDAYFLIGKTHFFTNDQFSAIETFQYVYSKYSDPYLKAQAQLWVMKSYVRQEKYSDAESILGLIRENEYPNKRLKGSTHLAAGDLYAKQGKLNLAIKELTEGVKLTKDKQLKYRSYFLLGQLCLATEQYELANTYFLKVIRMNSPYEFVFQANMGLTKATAQSGGKGIKSTKKNLRRMLKDDKNIDYFDQIYFELALLEFVEGNEPQGLDYLMKSSENAGANASQKTKTYLFLADYFFQNRNYDQSQKYYDSAVSVLPADYENYDGITNKHAVLSRLIENVQLIQLQDSLLDLASLPKDELDRKIDRMLEEIERAERLAKEEEEMQRERDALNPNSGNLIADNSGSGGVWYFYNAAQVGRGTNDFNRLWGKRAHGDWWRFANKSVGKDQEIKPEPEENENVLSYNPENDEEQQEALEGIEQSKLKYYENIPFSTTAKLIAHKKIQSSLLEIGKIYHDELKEWSKASEFLSRLLNDYPKGEHEAEGLFYMAKSVRSNGDTALYDTYALRIANEYPNTPFNQVLNNKEIEESGEDQEVIDLYTKMYEAYVAAQFDEVKRIKKTVAEQHAGNSIQAKFDYLYALTMGKTAGKEAYLEELQAITENYPGTEIANRAAYTIQYLTDAAVTQGTDLSMFDASLKGQHYYVISGLTEDVSKVEKELSDYNERFFPGTSFLIKSIELGDRQLFYIKPFKDMDAGVNYHNEMRTNLTFLRGIGLNEVRNYTISDSNFKALVKAENEADYLLFFKKSYPTEL